MAIFRIWMQKIYLWTILLLGFGVWAAFGKWILLDAGAGWWSAIILPLSLYIWAGFYIPVAYYGIPIACFATAACVGSLAVYGLFNSGSNPSRQVEEIFICLALLGFSAFIMFVVVKIWRAEWERPAIVNGALKLFFAPEGERPGSSDFIFLPPPMPGPPPV